MLSKIFFESTLLSIIFYFFCFTDEIVCKETFSRNWQKFLRKCHVNFLGSPQKNPGSVNCTSKNLIELFHFWNIFFSIINQLYTKSFFFLQKKENFSGCKKVQRLKTNFLFSSSQKYKTFFFLYL